MTSNLVLRFATLCFVSIVVILSGYSTAKGKTPNDIFPTGDDRAPGVCPERPRAYSEAAWQRDMKTAKDRGVLYQINRGDRTVGHLYGTIHVLQYHWRVPGPTIRQALNGSDALVVEVDTTDPEKVTKIQFELSRETFIAAQESPELAPKPRQLTVSQQKKIKQILDNVCAPRHVRAMDAFDGKLKAMSTLELAKGQFYSQYGVDRTLIRMARENAMPVHDLETSEENAPHLVAFLMRSAPKGNTDELLDPFLDGSLRSKTSEIADLWSKGALEQLRSECAESCNRQLLDARDQNMAHGIDDLIQRNKRPFVAVGALHLSGVREMLREVGYSLKRVVFK